MSFATIWWVISGILIALELMSGTFYLLMLAIGTIVAALAAHLGAGLDMQLSLGALCGGLSVFACYLMRKRSHARSSPHEDPNMSLDVGQVLHIEHWQDDGTASVQYRGTHWTAMQRPGARVFRPGRYRIVELVGSRLMVEYDGRLKIKTESKED